MGFTMRSLLEAVLPEKEKSVKERKHLGVLSLAALIFFSVSGGPYGTEDAVGAAGAKITLLGFMILPIIWCIPEALITAEYATAFPEATGGSAWAGAAFGTFWGWISAWFAFISGTINTSAYPVLMLSYLQLVWPELEGGWQKVLALVLITVVLFAANYCGLEVVGVAQVINSIFVLLPFVILFFFCLKDWDVGKWGQVAKPIDWETWINVMFWNLNYWSYAANMGGETVDQARTLPRSLLIAVVMVAFAYLVPLASTTAVLTKDSDWSVGFLGQAARVVAGKWLMGWVVVGAIFASIGLLLASLTTASYLAHGLGQRGFLPKIFTHRGRFDTPTWAIWVQVIPVCLLVNLDFEAILSMINTTFSASLLISFAAGIYLRVSMPDLPRPWRIPLNTIGFTLLMTPGLGLLVWVLVIPFYKVQAEILYCLAGTFGVGILLWGLMNTRVWRKAIPHLDWDLDWTRPPLAALEGPDGALPTDVKSMDPDVKTVEASKA